MLTFQNLSVQKKIENFLLKFKTKIKEVSILEIQAGVARKIISAVAFDVCYVSFLMVAFDFWVCTVRFTIKVSVPQKQKAVTSAAMRRRPPTAVGD
jgi:hypothetical protein